jgi:hypothetical protein
VALSSFERIKFYVGSAFKRVGEDNHLRDVGETLYFVRTENCMNNSRIILSNKISVLIYVFDVFLVM